MSGLLSEDEYRGFLAMFALEERCLVLSEAIQKKDVCVWKHIHRICSLFHVFLLLRQTFEHRISKRTEENDTNKKNQTTDNTSSERTNEYIHTSTAQEKISSDTERSGRKGEPHWGSDVASGCGCGNAGENDATGKMPDVSDAVGTIAEESASRTPKREAVVRCMVALCGSADQSIYDACERIVVVCQGMVSKRQHGPEAVFLGNELYRSCRDIFGTSIVANSMVHGAFTIMDASEVPLPPWVPKDGRDFKEKEKRLHRIMLR